MFFQKQELAEECGNYHLPRDGSWQHRAITVIAKSGDGQVHRECESAHVVRKE
jgi:hypothetical protein